MRRAWTIALALAAACGESPSGPHEVPEVPGQLDSAIPPEAYSGPPDFFGFRYGFTGQLTGTGIGVGHLPPDAGEMDRVPWLWIGCFVRESPETPYMSIDPVEGSSFPCGFRWHVDHLDAVVESPRTPLWEALVVVIVP